MLADSGLAMPDRFGALVLRSRAHEALGDLPNAIVDLEGALAIDATQARIWNELGLVSADAGMHERAMVAFEHATKSDSGYARVEQSRQCATCCRTRRRGRARC
jgi:lipoprotein NlpI